MFFATRDFKEVEEFCLTYFMMTTNMKDNSLADNEELKKVFGETMGGQFEHDLLDKYFSNQLESDEMDTMQKKSDGGRWLLIEEDQYLTMFIII